MAQEVKNLPARQEIQIQSLRQENPLKEEMATHSCALAWKINPTDRVAWTLWGCKELNMIERLTHTRICYTHIYYYPYFWVEENENVIDWAICSSLGLLRWLSKEFSCNIGDLGCLIPWRRKWQPIPVLLHGKSHKQRSLVGYSPCCHKELDTTFSN